MKPDALSLELPLSWARGPQNTSRIHTTPLLFKRTRWLSLAEIPEEQSFDSIIDEALNDGKRILIRGCTPPITRRLKNRGFDAMCLGREAVLDLGRDIAFKKSTRQLIRRGQRKGHLREVFLNKENRLLLQRLKRNSPHGRKPQLRHLFRSVPSAKTPLFIWVDAAGNWLAAITVSHISREKAHTELMVRHQRAPIGVMEALIDAVAGKLKEKGYRYFSLGEAPFIRGDKTSPDFRSALINSLGKTLQFVYNSQSLYRFKDKFSPQWQDLSICASPKISMLQLAAMAWHSRYLHLAGYSLRNSAVTLVLNFALMAYF